MRPKGSKEELAVRRKLAVKELKKGKGVCEVARQFDASSSSVSRWKRAYEEEGWAGLEPKRHPGRKPKVTEDDFDRLEELLLQGARAHGYPNDLWTLKRVKKLIKEEFEVDLHISNVWTLLNERMNWSVQKPEDVAAEKDEEKIKDWREKRWPHIKKAQTRG